MKNIILTTISILIIILISCNQESITIDYENTSTKNALLADQVKTTYFLDFHDTIFPNEWEKTIDKEFIYKNIFDTIFNHNYTVYNPNHEIDSDTLIVFDQDRVLKYLKCDSFPRNYDSLNGMVFYEEWAMDRDFKVFKKNIKRWSPILYFYWDRTGKIERNKVFTIEPGNYSDGKLIGEDIIYSFTFYDYNFTSSYIGIDKNKFLDSVFTKIKQGKIKAYDPIILIDKTKRILPVEELEKRLGGSITSHKIKEGIFSLIFIEDWYFDKKSLNILKKVKYLGFYHYDIPTRKDQIVCFIEFK